MGKLCPNCGSKYFTYGSCADCGYEGSGKELKNTNMSIKKSDNFCPNCGSDKLAKHKETGNNYTYCTKCDTVIDDLVNTHADKKQKYECDNCGARAYEDQSYCHKCGESFEDEIEDSDKIIDKNGYNLMILGAIIYFITFIISLSYSPDLDNIEDALNYSRLMAVLSFMGIITFMFGSIKQIKELM